MGNIVKCENCGCDHDGSYGSGKFCSSFCSHSFTAKKRKSHKSNFKKERKPEGWICPECGIKLNTKHELYDHRHKEHNLPYTKRGHANEGKHYHLNFELNTDPCPFCNKIYKYKYLMTIHLPRCSKNPDKSKSYPPRKQTEESKKILREKRIAILESNNPNDGFVKRWNRKPSYPELWMAKVIDNYFDDKNYISEMAFNRYALDFAWPDKKKCIEMDGSQHKLEKYAESDKRKDKALADAGWAIFRVEWNPRLKHEEPELIKKLKEFIDC